MTRIIALAVAATLGTASLASANSYFGVIGQQGGSSILDLGTVVSESAGQVLIFEGERLIGSKTIRMGANTNVRVDVRTPPRRDVTAVLSSGNRVLAEQRIDIDPS